MATIIEKDTDSGATAVLIFILFAVLLIGGIWFAYANGMFGKTNVVENTKTLVVPVPTPPAEPAPAKP